MTTCLSLNTVLADWLTLTSYDHPEFYKLVNRRTEELELFKKSAGEYVNQVERTKRMQYMGNTVYTDMGSVFFGGGMQNGRNHSMLAVSGELANEYLGIAIKAVKNEWAKVTRLDLQITAVEPAEWEQIRFFNRMKRRHRTANFIMSNDKTSGLELATVYVGSRSSERVARIYQKLTNSGQLLLRFEAEYKRHKAHAVLMALSEHTVSQQLLAHVQLLDDASLSSVFEPLLSGITPHDQKATVKMQDKTAEWLLSSALPAFEKVINQHDGNPVAFHFLLAMKNAGILDEA